MKLFVGGIRQCGCHLDKVLQASIIILELTFFTPRFRDNRPVNPEIKGVTSESTLQHTAFRWMADSSWIPI